jgi:hypothetical protein
MFMKRKVREAFSKAACSLLALAMVAGPSFADETATLSIKSIPNVNVRMYGFVENDLINDSTQGLAEETDNPAIKQANTYAGQHHQTIMSVRNSRLGFDVTMPKTENGLETEGIFEFDMLGNQPITETGGTSPTPSRDFYNNPAVRIRHAYVNITDGQWNAKIGQTWSLLGWQPYYFPSEADVQPNVGQLYRRFSQIRGMNTQQLMNGDWTLETAIDAARPAEIQSGLTIEQAGIRLASTKYKAPSGLGSSTPMVGASLGLSGEIIPIRTAANGTANGTVGAVDLLVPIIPSSDGKSASNTLGLTAEYSNGRGYGGLELAGATAGLASASAVSADGTNNLDSGIAGLDHGNLDLIHYQTYRGNLTYMWPGSHWANSIGYAATETLNLVDFNNTTTGGILKYQYYYGNVMYLPLTWLRFALEWAQYKDTYNDPVNRYAYDNRIQFTTYITF